MSWSTISEQHKATFHRDYVACHEPHERGWLVENVVAAFPQYRKSEVENAVVEVCTSMKVTPRLRKKFFAQLSVALDAKQLHVQEGLKKVNHPS